MEGKGQDSGGRQGKGDTDASIWRLVSREMARQGYLPSQQANARALLKEFILRRRPRVVRPGVYAAAVEYTIARADFLDHVTQAEVARRYRVSLSSVSRIHTDMMQSLGITVFDARYCSVEPPPHGPLELEQLHPLPDEASDLSAWEDPLFLEHLHLEQLKVLPTDPETWGGARLTLHSYVVTSRPFRPDLVLWANEATQEILGHRLLYPDDDLDAVLSSFTEAMLAPAVGPARRPARIRVENKALAQRLGAVLTLVGVEVVVGKTPGVHQAVQYFEDSMSTNAPPSSYLEEGRLPSQLMAEFFTRAASLARARPWVKARDDQVCSVDLFRWGQERMSAAIMGHGGLQRGLLLFSSLRDFRRFQRLASRADRTGRRSHSLQVDLLALTFHKGTELGQPRFKEVLSHGWDVADANAYPELVRLDADNIAVPLREEDYLIAGACARAVARLVFHQREAFANRGVWRRAPRVAEELEVEGAPVVITAPHLDLT